MQPRFRTVFVKDLLGAGCASSIEHLSQRVFRPCFLFFSKSWAGRKRMGQPRCKWFARSCVERDSLSDDYRSFQYVPRSSMVILNELYARPSHSTDFVSNALCRQTTLPRSAVCDGGDARIFVSPFGEGVGYRILRNRVSPSTENLYTNEYTITLNGGSLGSWVDEERS